MGAPDSQEDADTRYVPPPGAEPQIERLERQIPRAPRPERQSASTQPVTQRRRVDYDEQDDEEDEEQEAEEQEPAARRRPRALTDTGLIPRAWVAFVMVWIVRAILLGMLLVSFVGSIASFNPEGIAPILAAFPWLRSLSPWLFVSGADQRAVLIGALLQLWITGVEYWKAPPKLGVRTLFRRKNWFYTVHLSLDIGFTVYGWRPITVPWLVMMLGKTLSALEVASVPAWSILLAAYAIVVIAAFVFALLPERALLR